MIGNQAIINSTINEHEECVLPEKVGTFKRIDALTVISDEYWKEWRRLMRYADTPVIYCKELGKFKIKYHMLRKYLYKLLASMRYKIAEKSEQLKVEGMFSNILKNDRIAFKAAWKQADTFKKYMRAKNLKWRNKKIQKYGDKAIL